ncbi:TraB/GumN family protein [Trinickia symbiotica]|uniref:TraB/GumN family protein n=1 Tax=Trinickia symbiotica TaxID=863227 RepID=UPI000A047B53|nr:TraB/GumN family protein [Trinickia symbiotica]
MSKRRNRFFLSLLALAGICGVGHAPAFAESGVPALRVTAPNGRTSILLGSVHVGVDGIREPDATIFAGARRYVVEHPGLPQPDDYANVATGKIAPWATGLSATELATYAERARCAGVPAAAALAFLQRPSDQVANIVAYTACDWAHVPSRDQVLDQDKPPQVEKAYLEDDARVEARRRSLPATVGSKAFRWALAHDPKVLLTSIRDALNRGDYESIKEQADQSVGDVADARVFDNIMVDNRNDAWMPRLRGYLNDGNAVILVGAGHLPGPSGLIQRLRADGFNVEPTLLPPSSR